MLRDKLRKKLNEKKSQSLYRIVAYRQGPQSTMVNYHNQSYLTFCSNDYLGLANHSDLINRYKKAADRYGIGSGSAALVSGSTEAHQALEQAIANFTGYESAMLFSTGYMANLGVVSALAKADSIILQDRGSHASLIDGARLARGRLVRYRPTNIDKIKNSIESSRKASHFIVTHGVASTTGSIANLPQLIQLAQSIKACLIVDDAHGMGVLGKQGRGCLDYYHLHPSKIDILIGTFGKAFGTFGAFVASDSTIIEALKQLARPYIYTTALPPAILDATCASIELAQKEGWRREKLQQLIAYFQSSAKAANLPVLTSNTPIQAIPMGCPEKALHLCETLFRQYKLLIKALRPPTVPTSQDTLLRITLSALHETTHIDHLIKALVESLETFNKTFSET